MKQLILILFVTLLSSCGSITPEEDKDQKGEMKEKMRIIYQESMDDAHTLIDEDGCEYLLFYKWREGYMSHKGACKGPIHKK